MKKVSLFLAALACMSVASVAFAQEGAPTDYRALLSLAAGLAIGLGAFGGAIGQGWSASSALQGIARNPSASGQIFTPMIIALALIESLVIYSLVVAIMLWTKI